LNLVRNFNHRSERITGKSSLKTGGESGIRTHDTVARIPVFEFDSLRHNSFF